MTSKKRNETEDVLIDRESVSKISGLVHKYNDGFLADDSLSDLDVLLLSIHLIEQKNKTSSPKYNEVKNLFTSLEAVRHFKPSPIRN